MLSIFISALGLVFVIEGILPFLSPGLWRQLMQTMLTQSDHALRIMGLVSMLLGLGLVCLAHDMF